ncbi:E3 ubiquitin-protein ligase RNFT1 isoform X1 [Apteryx rowi]|uniref:E3 ubiquitin-protein ligase RNFT1 isoform X1 n=1 Tax=Apteryx rowi TaxID=308060 RepID=UPI000E1C7D97|nr:E3 ubiquitin-protein ligase RNFT1 isoform X1 [Apteryx rowi]XP_025927207.1 E3 ubiquitin-protein ligase RNFT1 isoform X1 [Apteryx rowi]
MQPNCSHLHNIQGNGDDSSSSQNVHAARLPGESSCHHSGDVRIQLNSAVGEARENASSRHSRPGSRSHSHGHAHSEAGGLNDSTPDSEEHSGSSLSELRYLLQWLHKSLPYILILCVKLITQHITGISLGIGLLTTFMYANKSIVNQVFLRERCSKLRCAWLLVYLSGSSLLLYYTFHSQSLYYSLIFLNPTVDFMNFWEVLWIVGITDFILKFLFMGFKCFILLVPSFMMSFKSKGYWYMLLEELCQYYRMFVPIPVWFRYLIGYGELDSALGWTLGILLGLLYLILKLLSFFGQLRNFKQVLRIFCTRPHYGVTASKRQCSESDDICSICQAEFQKPILLICQHTFCEECISLWFNREKTCPLCRTVISDHVNKWKDGATSMHLQIF